MSLHLPPSWDRLSAHARACYLCDSRQARDYADARRKVGRMEREARLEERKRAEYQQAMEKMKLA